MFKDSFLYFKPRDIVSGDFYWFDTVNSVSVVAVVDCTGHGVPGAFMSMIGREYIDQIVHDGNVESTAETLQKLDEKVSNAMRGNEEVKAQDGMDMAIIAYYHNTGQLQFSGAKNSLYIVRDGEVMKLKGDSYSIGGYRDDEKKFTEHTFWAQEGDCLYMTSDGYLDQFGGPKGKKYKIAQFVKMITNMSNLSMEKQYKVLDQTFTNWRGELEQIDDVCVVGIRI